MHDIPLGKQVDYPAEYSADILFPIPRHEARDKQGIDQAESLFQGVDIWTAYELSWLDQLGKPNVAIADATSTYFVTKESASSKAPVKKSSRDE